jgi:hypothetical protein
MFYRDAVRRMGKQKPTAGLGSGFAKFSEKIRTRPPRCSAAAPSIAADSDSSSQRNCKGPASRQSNGFFSSTQGFCFSNIAPNRAFFETQKWGSPVFAGGLGVSDTSLEDILAHSRAARLERVEHQACAFAALRRGVALQEENAALGWNLDASGKLGVRLDDDPLSSG